MKRWNKISNTETQECVSFFLPSSHETAFVLKCGCVFPMKRRTDDSGTQGVSAEFKKSHGGSKQEEIFSILASSGVFIINVLLLGQAPIDISRSVFPSEDQAVF